ncbi:putative membrane-bound dehydrogenase-like protein [Catalinimonas alkaloidigena]|uniref:PVC-type heme-binding CxxCH protein n=1 Tax=Catalinimonas alkaloidigena TaxID=1075417 RepID=UPI0024072E76|nr:PVC-type heme-binding CxxCH protein [Catalinimonas alkaloidigena]MDF9795236.1 putative membrane-bound dehydrogenase-like protein [Catalinimonas alkaloidigena]
MKHVLPFFLLVAFTACQQEPSDLSANYQNPIHTFEIMDGFRIELVASEPLVADPLAMEIDEYGRMYVVEMHGYPLDVAGSGKVKLLEDTNDDGLPDKSTVFADSLILPTGIMRWKNGVIVTDAPDVWYLEDSDNDGQADIKEKILTGFARSNPQHNLNTPLYGLDNWIYLAHESTVSTKFFHEKFGGEGEEVRFNAKPEIKLPTNANGRNVRFKPDTYELEALSGETQFGLSFDSWGHMLMTSNATHLFHEVLAAPYVQRNPNLAIPEVSQYLPSYGYGVEIFPITKNPEHQLLTDVGTITSACGVNWYQADLFPEEFKQVAFVAEPVHNLVHADVISDDGATFKADRLLENAEFLASTDSWFRPVNFYQGPDGALYLLDYYRKIIEHPEWMAEEVNESGELYDGTHQGRIYRIVPEGAAKMSFLDNINLGNETNASLVEKLAHPNLWWRRHAQRLLIDRQASEQVNLLQQMLTEHESAVGRLHALWTLEGLNTLDEKYLLSALQDQEAGLRENAIKISESYMNQSPAIKEALYQLVDDENAKVRFQLICSLGSMREHKAQQLIWQMLKQDIHDEWVQYAALSSAHDQEAEWLDMALAELTHEQEQRAAPLFSKLATMIGHSGNQQAIQKLINQATAKVQEPQWWQAASLRGLANSISPADVSPRMYRELLSLVKPETDPKLRSAGLRLIAALDSPKDKKLLSSALQLAIEAVSDQNADPYWRMDAIQLLASTAPERYWKQLLQLLRPQEPVLVQKAAIQSLHNTYDMAPCEFVLEKWPSLTPELRDEAINVFANSDERMLLLLEAVEKEQVSPATIGWRRSVELMNHDTEAVRVKARSLLADSKPNEAQVLKNYQSALTLEGNAKRGLNVFTESCARCHQFGGQLGTSIGPDLSAVRNRSKEAIMQDILMPNKSIADGFEFWQIKLNSNKQLSGIISAESVSALNLTDLSANESTIQRSDIEEIKDIGVSAMPAGLENQIDKQQMADLLEFLKTHPSAILQAASR